MSRMLSKMNLISVVQQLPKEDIETIQGYVEMIEEENQELKQKYLNAVADYETTMAENKELKKQVENTITSYTEEHNLRHNSDLKLDVLETQQKEFINYLEDEIKRINPNNLEIGELNLRLDDIKFTQYLIYKEILQKYKEIIGAKDEKK